MQSLHLFASGRHQDIDKLYLKLVGNQKVRSDEIVRKKDRLTASWVFGWADFYRIARLSGELPGLRMAIAWQIPRHNVGYSVYGAGVEELQDVEIIRGRRHADRLWKRANALAEAHVF